MSLVFSFSCSRPKHEKDFECPLCLCHALNPKEQTIEFIVVSPISRNQMDLSE